MSTDNTVLKQYNDFPLADFKTLLKLAIAEDLGFDNTETEKYQGI